MRGNTVEKDGLKFGNLPACSIAPQPNTLPRTPNTTTTTATTTTTTTAAAAAAAAATTTTTATTTTNSFLFIYVLI
jgi:hypothetical protein